MAARFIVGLFLTLLPARFRKRWLAEWDVDLRSSAMMSGISQMSGTLVLLVALFPHFIRAQMSGVGERGALGAMEVGGESALMGLGLIFLCAYILQPLSLLLIYFCFEGIVRFAAAMVTQEVVGTLPLYALDWAMLKARARAKEVALGPIVVDKVLDAPAGEQEYELVIASCRPKANWNALMTIEWQDQLYEVAREMEAGPPRRFVYLLRRAPISKVVRGLHHYDPEEVLVEYGKQERAEQPQEMDESSVAAAGQTKG